MNRGRSGQSLVEFGVALPVLLLLLLGMLDLGRAFYVREQVSDAARAALRVAIRADQHSAADTACAAGGAVSVVLPGTSSSIRAIAAAAAAADSPTGGPDASALAGATLTVTWHCSGGVAVTQETNQGITDPTDLRSDSVDVVLEYPLALLFPVIQRIAGPSVMLKVHEMGRVEY
jgi:Flp pilus assembly protein TadG